MKRIRAGHIVLIILALIVIAWNVANDGWVWLTLINVAIVVINLASLWWLRGL